MKQVNKGKVKANPEVVKLWGTVPGRTLPSLACGLRHAPR